MPDLAIENACLRSLLAIAIFITLSGLPLLLRRLYISLQDLLQNLAVQEHR